MYFPLPPIAALTSYMMYKTVFWSSFFQVLWPTFPLAFFITIRKNLVDNCQASIDKIELTNDGTNVRIKDLSGKVREHPISSLRKATDAEIIRINKAGGPAFVERMKDFYPVMVQSSQNSIDLGKADVR